MIASETPTVTAAISAAKVMRSVIQSESDSVPQSFHSVCADQQRAGQDVVRDALEADRQFPGGERQDADHDRRDDAGPGARRDAEDAPLLGEHRPRFGVGAVVGHGLRERQVGHAAIASFSVSDATRQRCAYSAEVRNRPSRG